MKLFKLTLALIACGIFSGNAPAQSLLTPAQEKAQHSLYFFLDKEKFHPDIDTSDNSVCFRKDGILYWVTFSDTTPTLYTLHRKGYKVGVGKDLYEKTPAIIAANEVNLKLPGIKVVVSDDRVSLVLETYAATPQDYNNMFKNCFRTFINVDANFKAAYKEALNKQKADNEETLRQITEVLPPSALRNSIKAVEFRLVDGAGYPITQFNEPLRSHNARFIQPAIRLNPWNGEPRTATLYIKVTAPDGEPIYLPGKKYTAQIEVPYEKSKKADLIELPDVFGSEKEGFWKAGEYKFEILDAYDVIYQTTFNLL